MNKDNKPQVNTDKHGSLIQSISEVIEQGRNSVRQAVNVSIVSTYWNVGKLIVEDEQQGAERAEYGKAVLKELSLKLTDKYGGGFDLSNLRKMRQFFQTFPKQDALRLELSWTHYRTLLRVENSKARQWYIDESINENWSARALERQINSHYFERLLSSQNKQPVKAEASKKIATPGNQDIIKDPYVLEFLELKNRATYTENELESALINELQNFLLELGSGFSFVARQKHIHIDGEHFYIDLIFYNYKLKCFVLIDLKRGKLTHQDVGQMDMYIKIFEEKMRAEDDNPTVGLILCSDKSEAVAKYSILAENEQIFASKYKLVLPSEKELVKELEDEMANIVKKGNDE